LGAVVSNTVIGGTGGTGGNNGNPGSANGYVGPYITTDVSGSRSNSKCGAPGGPSGISGFGIIITNNGTGVTITSPGTLIGDIVYNTSVS
jgi:hypothetical protein